MSDFYIGYVTQAPPRLARFIGRGVASLLVLALALAAVFLLAQKSFAPSRFEYGVVRDYEGVVQRRPYPMLVTKDAQFLLAGPGKHGFALPAEGPAKLSASLIERGADQMLEVVHIESMPGDAAALIETALGPLTIAGEIVDSKCHLGVMNPGDGKVHRDCATRCISGGIPPALVARDSSGVPQFVLVTGIDVLPFVAEPVQVRGALARVGWKLVLHASGINRIESRITQQ
jgi:hypothetical protein